EIFGEHTGYNMATVVWDALKKFGLKGRITAFVVDNASNNDTLVEAIEYFCYNEGIPGFMMKDARMR
ncbi:hypothetical protein BT96DRAFT_759386, partial [Gymnopus androsaceus JB14]